MDLLFPIAGGRRGFSSPRSSGTRAAGCSKSSPSRSACRSPAKGERGLILTPKEEIARAWRLYEEDQAQTGLTIVGKGKR
jgi:hypothetical protein